MSDSRRGVRLNVVQFERELACRGLQAKQLAEQAGVSEHLIVRARRGVPIAPESLTKIVKALGTFKPLPGAGALLEAS